MAWDDHEMYVPKAFAVPDLAERFALVRAAGPAHLVSAGDGGLTASVVPMLLEGEDAATGRLGSLVGHLARPNPQWRAAAEAGPDGVEALAILPGPDAYVSPSWYPSKADTGGKVVPTWNYVVVHAAGRLVVHDDPAWLDGLVRRLTERHEAPRPEPWSVDDAPPDFVAATLRGIVGVELRIERLEVKAKLSQNRPEADQAAVVDALAADGPGAKAVSDAMRGARRP